MLKEYIENHKEEIITIPMENIKCVVTTDNRYNFVRKNLKTYHIGKNQDTR